MDLQKIATQQAPRAVRCVKFSSEPVDLMSFAEHDKSFHLVDARCFGARQTVNASAASVGISGLAFSAEVRYGASTLS
jgi:hypothetical protein